MPLNVSDSHVTMKLKFGRSNQTTKNALRNGKMHWENEGQTIIYGGKN